MDTEALTSSFHVAGSALGIALSICAAAGCIAYSVFRFIEWRREDESSDRIKISRQSSDW